MSVCKMVPGWNTPQGVENVYTLCASKREFNERDHNIYVKRLETPSMY